MIRLHRLARAGALLLGGALGACGATEPGAQPRLTGGARTLDALGTAVWNGIVAQDTATLGRLRLSEYEHNRLVWPEQPAAREPSAAQNLDFWWHNIQLRNRAALQDLLGAYGRSELTLVDTRCHSERRFQTYRALTDCELLLQGGDGGRRVQAFRHVIVMDGVHKLVRFYGDE